MEREVVGDEAGDEVVRVIVALLQCVHAGAYVDLLGWASEASSLRLTEALLHAQLEFDAALVAHGGKCVGAQLVDLPRPERNGY